MPAEFSAARLRNAWAPSELRMHLCQSGSLLMVAGSDFVPNPLPHTRSLALLVDLAAWPPKPIVDDLQVRAIIPHKYQAAITRHIACAILVRVDRVCRLYILCLWSTCQHHACIAYVYDCARACLCYFLFVCVDLGTYYLRIYMLQGNTLQLWVLGAGRLPLASIRLPDQDVTSCCLHQDKVICGSGTGELSIFSLWG